MNELRPFEFSSAGRIVFGSGSATSLGERARRLGRRALWVTGKSRERVASLEARLVSAGVGVTIAPLHAAAQREGVVLRTDVAELQPYRRSIGLAYHPPATAVLDALLPEPRSPEPPGAKGPRAP